MLSRLEGGGRHMTRGHQVHALSHVETKDHVGDTRFVSTLCPMCDLMMLVKRSEGIYAQGPR